MILYCFMDPYNKFLCRKPGNKIYASTSYLDRIITYRRKADAENIKRESSYWTYRNIDISKFRIQSITLSIDLTYD